MLQFSANPGRFSLTEISTDDNGQESTEIRAEFPWGQETIETIHNVSTKMFDNLDPAVQETFLVSIKLRISTLPSDIIKHKSNFSREVNIIFKP